MTEQQILTKLTAVCSRAEYCKEDIRRKMERWEVADDIQEKVIAYLIKERYIDEERYARCFIKAKKEYNHWGEKKIEQALYMKRIPKDIYEPILKEICNNDFRDILKSLLQNKKRSVKASSDYELRGKLIRFAMQRGFTYDQICKVIDEI
jgi:regulatory protein